MKDPKDDRWLGILFYLGLALLCSHELDAVARHEWRLLPLLSRLDDQSAFLWFVLLHVPLLTLIFWFSGHESLSVRRHSRAVVGCLLVVHGIVHFFVSGHPLYEFTQPVETITVHGAALAGFVYICGIRIYPAADAGSSGK